MARIGTESRRMGALVDDLLLLARLDQGRPVRRDPVDLSRIADDAVADARALEPARTITASIDTGVTVAGDEDRLRQVIGNLLANVRVHTPAGTPIEVLGADGRRRRASCGSSTTGRASTSPSARTVFDRFYRADPGRSRDNGGTGLGLSIAAALVQAHEGRIWHEATPGGGATFVVRLPMERASTEAAVAPETDRAFAGDGSRPPPAPLTANSQPEHGSPTADPASV